MSGPGADGDEVQVGRQMTLTEQKLQEAGGTLLLNTNDRLKEVATTLIAQAATTGSVFGLVSLVGDETKQRLITNHLMIVAAVAAGLSVFLALWAAFRGPNTMPNLDDVGALQVWWNARTSNRRQLLVLSLVTLMIGLSASLIAFFEAVAASSQANATLTAKISAAPTAALSGASTTKAGESSSTTAEQKLSTTTTSSSQVVTTPTPAKPGSVEATASWVGLKPRSLVLFCVVSDNDALLARQQSQADSGGKASFAVTAAIPTNAQYLRLITFRLRTSAQNLATDSDAIQTGAQRVCGVDEKDIASDRGERTMLLVAAQ